jgi:cell division transport system ATP-binding protein
LPPTGGIDIEILLEHVSKRYAQAGYAALEDVSLHIDSGSWVGRVLVDGNDVAQMPGSRLRRSMGIIFQTFRLLEKKTAFENIAYGAEVLAMPPDEVRKRTREILELVGLANKAGRMPGELSGGEQQRVAIGRALINRPKLIVADEPTGDLDPENSDRVIQILDTVHREHNVTVLFATHAVDIVNRLQRRVVRLEHGRVVSDALGGYWAGNGEETE